MSRTASVASELSVTALDEIRPTSELANKPFARTVDNLANALGSDGGCQADSTRLLSELLSSIKTDLELKNELVHFLVGQTKLERTRVEAALETLASRHASQVGTGGTQPTQPDLTGNTVEEDVRRVEKALMSDTGRFYVNALRPQSRQVDGGIDTPRQLEIGGGHEFASPKSKGGAGPVSNGFDQNSWSAPIPLLTRVDATSPGNLPLPSLVATAASGTAASDIVASGTAVSGTSPGQALTPAFTCESILGNFENSLTAIQASLDTVKKAKDTIQESHGKVSSTRSSLRDERSLVSSINAIAGIPSPELSARIAAKTIIQNSSQKELKHLITEQISSVPTSGEIIATGKMLDEVETTLERNIEEIVQEVEKSSNGDKEKTQNALKEKETDLRALEAKLKQVAKLKEGVANALDHRECIEGFDRWAKDGSGGVSFPLAMKWMGLREGDSRNASFVEALRHSDVGAGNHALDRAMSLRVGMAGLLSQIRPGEHSRTDVAVMGDRLKNKNKDEQKRVMDLFQKEDSNNQTQTATENLASLAAINLIAAGYNPMTMERDAPRLQYKVENKGFSSLKKATYIGRSGVTVRSPAKHVMPRLNALKEVQETIRSALYPDNLPANVDPALTSKENLQEFASIMIASMPQDFLVTKPELVRQLTDLSKQCSEKESKFSELKAGFLKVHQEVAEALKSYKPNEAAELADVSDEAVIRVHRRSCFFKAAEAIGRSFMKLIGRPIVNLAKAIQNLWVDGIAVERFKEEMFKKQGDADRLATVIALNKALGETDPERLGLITKFMQGEIDRIDLSGLPLEKLSADCALAIKKHAEDSWKRVNKDVPVPYDLVLLHQSVFSTGAFNESPPQNEGPYFLPIPSNYGSVPRRVTSQGDSGGSAQIDHGVVQAPDHSIPVNYGSNAVVQQPVHSQEAPITVNDLVKISGEKNLCWMRAANASAIDLLKVDGVIDKVAEALENAQKDWGEKQKNMISEKMISDDYTPVWPDKNKLRQIYNSFVVSWDKGFAMSDDEQEIILRKITLQIAADQYLVRLVAALTDDDGVQSDQHDVQSIKNNFRELFDLNDCTQAEFELVQSFILGLNLEHAHPTALRSDTLGRCKPGKLNIYNEGDASGGHYQYFPQEAVRRSAKVTTQTVAVG